MKPGISENTRSQVSPVSVLGNGRIQPPSHKVTAMEETAIIAAYSPSMNRDQRKPLYSVWNPAVSSDSASGRSKGARLVSATMAMAKMTNAIKPSGKNLNKNQTCCSCCAWTMPIMLKVPVPDEFVATPYIPGRAGWSSEWPRPRPFPWQLRRKSSARWSAVSRSEDSASWTPIPP